MDKDGIEGEMLSPQYASFLSFYSLTVLVCIDNGIF